MKSKKAAIELTPQIIIGLIMALILVLVLGVIFARIGFGSFLGR